MDGSPGAGFDAHWRDPLEKLNYQSATYHHLLTSLQGLADELCGAHQASVFCSPSVRTPSSKLSEGIPTVSNVASALHSVLCQQAPL